MLSELYREYQKQRQPKNALDFAMPSLGNAQSTAMMTDEANAAIEIPKAIVQGSIRQVFVMSQAATAATLGLSPDELAKFEYQPRGLGKILMGDKPVGLKSEGSDFVKMFGVDEERANEVGVLAIAGFTALDILTGGQARTARLALLNAKEVRDAAKVMRNVGFEDDIINDYAEIFAKASTDKEVGEALEAAIRLQETTRRSFTVPLKTVDGTDVITVGGKVLNDEVASIRTALIRTIDEVGGEALKRIREGLETTPVPTMRQLDEAAEALKADDLVPPSLAAQLEDVRATLKTEPQRFVPNQKPIYHGTAAQFDSFADEFLGSNTGAESAKRGVFAVADREGADEYAKLALGKKLRASGMSDDAMDGWSEGAVIVADSGSDLKIAEKFVEEGLLEKVKNGVYRFVSSDKNIKELYPTGKMKEVDLKKTGRKPGDFSAIADLAKSEGYDGVIIRNTYDPGSVRKFDAQGEKISDDIYITFNSDTLKTRKQLEDAWNRSQTKKLDEVANPVKEDLGMLNVNLQERYGKGAIKKSQAEKFKAAEHKVFHEVFRYAEEVRHVAEKGGEMVQTMPKWIPEGLRDVTVMENVTKHFQAGTLPVSHTSQEMALYTAMVDEVARRAGVKTRPVKAVDAEGAVVESMRMGTRKPGGKAPLVQTEKGATSQLPDVLDDVGPGMSEADLQEAVREFNASRRPTLQKPEVATNEHVKFLDDLEKMEIPFDGEGFKVQKGTDISSTALANWEDVYTNSKKVFGKHWDIVKAKIFDVIDAAKAEMISERKVLRESVHTDIVKQFGFKRKSKEAAAIQRFGEGGENGLSYGDLVRDFGKVKADNIVAAAKWFRVKYDSHIADLNAVERRIYPDRPEKLTPNRKDYFRHMQEIGGDWARLQNLFETPSLSNLAPDSIFLKEKLASIKQKREGEKAVIDAISGYLNYVDQFVYAKHIDPQAARLGDWTKALKNKYGESLQNYTDHLGLVVDDLTGRANPVDRFFGKHAVGRFAIDVVDVLNNRAKRNAILLNGSAALSQILMSPFVVAFAKQHSLRGVLRTIGDFSPEFLKKSGGYTTDSSRSQFLAERYKDIGAAKFSVGFFENAEDFAGWMISVVDHVNATFAWNSFYEKAIRTGKRNPVKYADDMARHIVGGRGIMETPTIHKSKVLQTVIPFQYEVAKSWFLLKEMVSEKDFAGIAAFMVSSYYLMGTIKDISGSDSGLNLGQALVDSYQIATKPTFDAEGEADTKGDKAKKIGGRFTGEIMSNIPLGSYFATAAVQVSGMTEEEQREFFGERDPLRFGNSPLLWTAATENPLYRLFPKYGGRQLEKTVGGIRALATDEVVSKDGVLMDDVPVQPGVMGALRNIAFGQYAPNFEYRDELENEMLGLYRINEGLMSTGTKEGRDEVEANIESLSEAAKSAYKTVFKQQRAEEFEREKKEMAGTYRIVTALVEQGKRDEAKAILDKLTDEEKKVYRGVHKDMKAQIADETLTMDEDAEGIIRTVMDYSYAFVTNPVQAWRIVFKDHMIIRDTIGGVDGAVRTRRRPYKGAGSSSEIKETMAKELGVNEEEVELGHIVPSALGGREVMENYVLETPEVNKQWQEVENYLIDAVKLNKVSFRAAQEMILRYKGRAGEPLTFEEIKQAVGVEAFPDRRSAEYKAQSFVLTDVGKDTWLLGNEDKTDREGGRLTVTGKIRDVLTE